MSATKHKIEYLRCCVGEGVDDMHARIEAVCDTYANSGWEVISISFESASVEAWIVLRTTTSEVSNS